MKKFFLSVLVLLGVAMFSVSCTKDDDIMDNIEFSTLPQPAQTYISTNFPLAKIILVQKRRHPRGDDSVYEVTINQVINSNTIKIEFDKDGVVKEIDN